MNEENKALKQKLKGFECIVELYQKEKAESKAKDKEIAELKAELIKTSKDRDDHNSGVLVSNVCDKEGKHPSSSHSAMRNICRMEDTDVRAKQYPKPYDSAGPSVSNEVGDSLGKCDKSSNSLSIEGENESKKTISSSEISNTNVKDGKSRDSTVSHQFSSQSNYNSNTASGKQKKSSKDYSPLSSQTTTNSSFTVISDSDGCSPMPKGNNKPTFGASHNSSQAHAAHPRDSKNEHHNDVADETHNIDDGTSAGNDNNIIDDANKNTCVTNKAEDDKQSEYNNQHFDNSKSDEKELDFVIEKEVPLCSLNDLSGSLSEEISRNARKVLQLEKENKHMKILLLSLSEKNEQFKKEIDKLKKSILFTDHNPQSISTDKDDASLAPTSFKTREVDDELIVRSIQQTWLHVEKQQTAALKAQETKNRELEAKLAKYERRNQKLLDANSAWDNHCKQTERKYTNQIEEVKKQLQDQAMKEERKVRNLEVMLEEEKKLHEREKVSLERKVRSFKEECEREAERANVSERKVNELHHEITALQGIIDALNSDMRSIKMTSVNYTKRKAIDSSLMGAEREELLTQIGLLKQQIEVCTEDFTKEREDRARAQSQKDDLNTKLRQKKDELQQMQRELRRMNTSLETKTRQLAEAEEELNQVKLDFRRLLESSHNVTRYMSTDPPSYHEQNPTAPTESAMMRAQYPQVPWNCLNCTYENDFESTLCRMCRLPRGENHDH